MSNPSGIAIDPLMTYVSYLYILFTLSQHKNIFKMSPVRLLYVMDVLKTSLKRLVLTLCFLFLLRKLYSSYSKNLLKIRWSRKYEKLLPWFEWSDFSKINLRFKEIINHVFSWNGCCFIYFWQHDFSTFYIKWLTISCQIWKPKE